MFKISEKGQLLVDEVIQQEEHTVGSHFYLNLEVFGISDQQLNIFVILATLMRDVLYIKGLIL